MRAGRWPVLAVPAAVLLVLSLVLAVVARQPAGGFAVVEHALLLVVGVVILRNRSRNVVGWCFLVAAALLSLNAVGSLGLVIGFERHWPGWLLHLAGWANIWWFPGLAVLITVALLHFPDGLLSPGWRWLSHGSIALLVVYAITVSIDIVDVPVAQLRDQDGTPQVGGWRQVLLLVGFGCVYAVVPVLVAVVVSLVLRYRRSDITTRQQLRWVASAGTLAVLVEFGLAAASAAFSIGDTWQDVLEPLSFGMIAVATGVAITRHGLYEIDRIVSRTVSYLVISAVLVGVYAAVVSCVALVIPDRYGSVGVAVATLAAVALFVPLRSRVQRLVDRRFDRARYDAERLVGGFAAVLRENRTSDGSDGVHEELLRAVRRTVAPSTATIWIAPPISAGGGAGRRR